MHNNVEWPGLGPLLALQTRHHPLADLKIIETRGRIDPAWKTRECLEDIRAADNADDLSLFNDGDTLDQVLLEELGNLAEWRIRSCGHDIASHDVRYLPTVSFREFNRKRIRGG